MSHSFRQLPERPSELMVVGYSSGELPPPVSANPWFPLAQVRVHVRAPLRRKHNSYLLFLLSQNGKKSGYLLLTDNED